MQSKADPAAYCVETLESRRLLSAGDLDTNFGVGGYALPIDRSHDEAIASALVTPGGKTIVAGTRQTVPGKHLPTQLFVEQLNGDGSIDSTFGRDGIAAIREGFSGSTVKALLQTDGKIVLVGTQSTADSIAVVRFNSDGTLDHTFNGNGQLAFQFDARKSYPNGAALTSSDQLVISATTERPGKTDQPALCQLNTDGSFDQSFATGGQLLFGSSVIFNVLVRPDDRIVIGGQNTAGEFVFGQLHSDGTFDQKFANGGIGTIALGHARVFEKFAKPVITLTASGDLLYAGTVNDPEISTRSYVLAVTTKGKVDRTFGDGGSTKIKGALTTITASQKQIYIVGQKLTLYRLSLTGVLSPSFGSGGALRLSFPDTQYSGTFPALSLDGGFISAVVNLFSGDSAAAVVRLTPSGGFDGSFGLSGIADLQTVGTNASFYDVTGTADGKIIAFGVTTDIAHGTTPIIEELNSDGSPNSDFGNSGLVLLDEGDSINPKSVVVDPNSGKIYVGFNNLKSGVIGRLNPDGSRDLSWGAKGEETINWLSGQSSTLNNLLIQSDGKLLVSGLAPPKKTTDLDFTIARFNTDGTLDTSFDQDGRVATSLGTGTGDNSLARMLLYPNGKILLVGTRAQSPDSTKQDLALIRYNSNGGRDATFGSDGKVFTNATLDDDEGNGPFSAKDIADDAALMSNGQIVVADAANSDFGLGLVLYNSDGSLKQAYQNAIAVGNRIAATANNSIVVINSDGHSGTTVDRDTSALVIDNTFVTADFTGFGRALAIDRTGRILVAGAEGSAPLIVRLLGS